MSQARKTYVSRRGKTVQPLQVYDGQKLIGELKDYGRGNVDAFGVDQGRRVKIGTFQNRTDAMRAISRHVEFGCLDAARKQVLGPVAYTTGLPEHFLTAGRNQTLASK
jgi:hypothetical protein